MTQADHEATARELCADELCRWRKTTGGKDYCESCDDIRAALDAVRDAERERWEREVQHEIDSCDNAAVCLKLALILSRMGVVLK